MQEILVDENGYKQFIEELNRLKEISNKSASVGSQAYNDAVGDGWHDNFAFEESMRESRTIAKRIDDMLDKQKYLKIVKNIEDKDKVAIGNIITIEIKYSENDIEIDKVMLIGNYLPNASSIITEITLNSPLGKALFKSKIGEDRFYFVGNKKISFKALKIEIE